MRIFPGLICAFVLSACQASASLAPTVANTPSVIKTATPILTNTVSPTHTLTIPPPSPTISLAMLDRPVFLAWPLPASIGTARISQYPDTAWTWHYLGLNDGYSCPPMFGYLLNLDSLAYWRDTSISEEQDKAQADPHNFEMVECYAEHEGTDIKAPAGTSVYAVEDGKVQQWQSIGVNSMIVLKHCLGGTWDTDHQCVGGRQWFTTYMHLVLEQSLLQESMDVARGAQVGTIYDQTINSHLHFEVGLEKRMHENLVNPWGQDHSPWLGCMWLDQSLCVNPDPAYKRMAFYLPSERLVIEQGEAEPIEIYTAQGVEYIRLWGKHIAIVDSLGNLLIPTGQDQGHLLSDDLLDWKVIAKNVEDFQITDRRIAILDANGSLLLQEDSLESEWIFQAENVSAFSVSDHRIGYLTDNGDLLVKEGGVEKDWLMVANDVLAFHLIDCRIAFVDQQGNLYVNEGEVLAEYQQMARDIRAFQLTDVRLGIIDTEKNLLVKEGNLRAEWVLQAENVQSFQLADYRILMCDLNGRFRLKEGNLYQEWRDLPFAYLKDAFLNGEMPVYVP